MTDFYHYQYCLDKILSKKGDGFLIQTFKSAHKFLNNGVFVVPAKIFSHFHLSRRPKQRSARKNMNVQVENTLPRFFSRVNNGSEISDILFFHNFLNRIK